MFVVGNETKKDIFLSIIWKNTDDHIPEKLIYRFVGAARL
jgi:hypothetical protein